MTYQPTALVTVYFDARGQRHKVGRLAVKDRHLLFEYDAAFIASGIDISPIKLPLRSGVQICDEAIYDGLFGVFNDSVPDGWGRLLLDRTVEGHGVNRHQLTPLDRLAYVGRYGMGALSYEPEIGGPSVSDQQLSLGKLADESSIVLNGENEEVFDDLLSLSGSAGGARPKIITQVSTDKKRIIHGRQDLQDGFSHWIIKFRSLEDVREIGAIEYAYSLMARHAGVNMAETHLFRGKTAKYFGIKRFDRDGDARIHMHSLGGLIHADHRTPSLDYDTVLRVTLGLTRSILEVEKVYALACFNVLAHNRDDHVKNFSFLLDANQEWILAPAYDLVFSNGPGGEQSMLVMGEGRSPGTAELQALGKRYGLKSAAGILDRTQAAISNWPRFADEASVSAKLNKIISATMSM